MSRTQRSLLATAFAVLALSGCGGDGGGETDETTPVLDPGATEASPESPPAEAGDGEVAGEEEGETLAAADEAAVTASVERYITALNEGRGDVVCALVAPGAVDPGELPRSEGDCADAVKASIGHRRRGGTPAWEKTTIREVGAVSVGADQARVTATVTHDFADRKYVSVEEDVIYLRKSGEKWLVAKPSGTFYRAVGYPEPPLRALTPP